MVCIKVDIYQNSGNRTCRLNNTLLGQVKAVVPDANLVVAEQTFSWMSKFKKTLNSMPKRHQLFMLHRLVRGRNSYTEHWIQRCLFSLNMIAFALFSQNHNRILLDFLETKWGGHKKWPGKGWAPLFFLVLPLSFLFASSLFFFSFFSFGFFSSDMHWLRT